MASWTRCALVLAGVGAIVRASPAPVAAPEVTPAARLLPRVNERTLGWYSSATVGVTTLYSAWAYDADETTYSTSSTWFRRCAVGYTCTMYTGCSDGYLVAQDTSSYCGAGGASGASFCSNHVLYTTMGDSVAYSWYWCDQPPLTGYTFYENEPSQSGLDTSSTPASSDASTTSSTESSTSTSSSATRSSTSPAAQTSPAGGGGGSSHTGAIAGGVVGGIAGLALIGAAIFFLLRRSKKKHDGSQPPPGGYAPPPQQPGMYQQPGYPVSPNMGYATAYQANEAKPQGVQEGAGWYGQQQPAAYPQGPYDPHMSQYGGSPPPQQMSSPQPQYGAPQFAAPQHAPQHGDAQPMPQELPTQAK